VTNADLKHTRIALVVHVFQSTTTLLVWSVLTDVRLVHLLTHLQTRVVLTEEQQRIYHEVRWGS
jgi:hypothetical protein